MIENVLSLNEMTKKYRSTFNSGDENAFRFHLGNNIVKFTANDERLCLSKPEKIIFSK